MPDRDLHQSNERYVRTAIESGYTAWQALGITRERCPGEQIVRDTLNSANPDPKILLSWMRGEYPDPNIEHSLPNVWLCNCLDSLDEHKPAGRFTRKCAAWVVQTLETHRDLFITLDYSRDILEILRLTAHLEGCQDILAPALQSLLSPESLYRRIVDDRALEPRNVTRPDFIIDDLAMPFRLLVNALSNQQIDSKYGETWLNLERFALSRSQPGLQCGDFQSYILRAPYNPALLGQPNLELIAQSLDIYIDDYKTMLPEHGTKWFKLNVLRQIVAEFPYFQNWTSALNQIAVARSWPDWANAAISSDEFSESTAQGREFNRVWDLDHWTIAAQKLAERLASA